MLKNYEDDDDYVDNDYQGYDGEDIFNLNEADMNDSDLSGSGLNDNENYSDGIDEDYDRDSFYNYDDERDDY